MNTLDPLDVLGLRGALRAARSPTVLITLLHAASSKAAVHGLIALGRHRRTSTRRDRSHDGDGGVPQRRARRASRTSSSRRSIGSRSARSTIPFGVHGGLAQRCMMSPRRHRRGERASSSISIGLHEGRRRATRATSRSLSLFAFSMQGIVFSTNLVQTFMFWELVGVSSYALIGYYYEKPSAVEAGKKAFLTNRIGDFGMTVRHPAALLHPGGHARLGGRRRSRSHELAAPIQRPRACPIGDDGLEQHAGTLDRAPRC